MGFAALLSVTFSLPATAFDLESSPGFVTAAESAGTPQLLEVAGADAAGVARDNYSVTEPPPPPPPVLYAWTAPTFVNVPGSRIQWPFAVDVPLSSDFGPRVAPCGGCSTYHQGIDMIPGNRTPIGIIADGVVVEASAYDNGGLGVYAIVEHQIDGQTVTSLYAHMAENSLAVSVGDTVTVGQQVGLVGNTGQSTGPHLHLGIKVEGTFVDPYAWLSQRAG